MGKTFARFDAAVVGAGQLVESAGLEVVSAGIVLDGHARADLAQPGAVAGIEAAFYGPGGTPETYDAIVGLVDDSTPAGAIPGQAADTVGLNIASGELWAAGARIAAGAEVPALQTIVGMQLDETGAVPRVRWYVEERLVVYADLHPAGATSDGVWLGDENWIPLVTPAGEAIRLE